MNKKSKIWKIKTFFVVVHNYIKNIWDNREAFFSKQLEIENAEKKYKSDVKEYICQTDSDEFVYYKSNEFPQIFDYTETAGRIDGHYFYQDIFVARLISAFGVLDVYDIGSRVDGFISHLISMGIEVTMIDIRPLNINLDGLHFAIGNAMDLHTIKSNSVKALSCLHALEHFGLGRYGDPINYNGWKIALNEMIRVVCDKGRLYLSVPISHTQRVCFNAHRVFDPVTIIDAVGNRMHLIEFHHLAEGRWSSIQVAASDVKSIIEEINSSQIGLYDLGVFVFEKHLDNHSIFENRTN